MSGYVKTFNHKVGVMSFRIDDNKLSEKYKTIWTKIKDLKNTEMDAVPVYDDKHIKIKITYGEKVYANFCRLDVPEDDVKCKSFKLQILPASIYIYNSAYKNVNTQMIDYVDYNFFESDEN